MGLGELVTSAMMKCCFGEGGGENDEERETRRECGVVWAGSYDVDSACLLWKDSIANLDLGPFFSPFNEADAQPTQHPRPTMNAFLLFAACAVLQLGRGARLAGALGLGLSDD